MRSHQWTWNVWGKTEEKWWWYIMCFDKDTSWIWFWVLADCDWCCGICGPSVTIPGSHEFLQTPRAVDSESHKPGVRFPDKAFFLSRGSPQLAEVYVLHGSHCTIFLDLFEQRISLLRAQIPDHFIYDIALSNLLEEHQMSIEHLKAWVGQVSKRSWKAKRNVPGQYLSYKKKRRSKCKIPFKEFSLIPWFTGRPGWYLC